jgi:hypothetical protein
MEQELQENFNADELPAKKKLKLRSNVWRYFTEVQTDDDKVKTICVCGKVFSHKIGGSTSNMHRHIRICAQCNSMESMDEYDGSDTAGVNGVLPDVNINFMAPQAAPVTVAPTSHRKYVRHQRQQHYEPIQHNTPDHDLYLVSVYVPMTRADKIRQTMAESMAGTLEDGYDSCTFSTKGTGRFRPLEGATPTIGEIGKVEAVEEEKVESVVKKDHLTNLLQNLKKMHPYEKPCIIVAPVVNYTSLLDI